MNLDSSQEMSQRRGSKQVPERLDPRDIGRQRNHCIIDSRKMQQSSREEDEPLVDSLEPHAMMNSESTLDQ